MINHETLRAMVVKILEEADAFEWTLQGLGMLRLYFTQELRLHVWDSAEAYPGASKLHDHPWDFSSHVVLGRLENIRYCEINSKPGELTHTKQTIVCGAGGCALGDKQAVTMRVLSTEEYEAGDSYSQRAEEVHESNPEPGTVTLIQRTFKGDTEHARVFAPYGQEWISAEPRQATAHEIRRMTRKALECWT